MAESRNSEVRINVHYCVTARQARNWHNALVAPELTHVHTLLDSASLNAHFCGNGWKIPIHELQVVVSCRFA
jgi:hypothetical protein